MLHCSAPEVDSFIQLCSSRKYPYPLPTEGNGTSQGRGGGWSKRRQFPIDLKAISYFTVNRCFKAKIIVVIDDLLFAVG